LKCRERGVARAILRSEFFRVKTLTVRANSIDRAGFEGFNAQLPFGVVDWLLVDEGESAGDVTFEVVRCYIPADVAVDTLAVDVKLAGHILRKS
jgi:hypothetical protein